MSASANTYVQYTWTNLHTFRHEPPSLETNCVLKMNDKLIAVIRFLHHCSALTTVSACFVFVFWKENATLVSFVKLHTGVISLHSLQWFSRVMSDGFWRGGEKQLTVFIPVHVGKKRSSIAVAAIVLCTTTLTHVIATPFCTFIQFWYLMAPFDNVLCYRYVIYFETSRFLRDEWRNAPGANGESCIQRLYRAN